MSATFILLLVLSIVGILDTLHLLYHKLKGTDVECVIFPQEWCERVQASHYSRTFGIPNSVLGLILYAVIFLLTLLWGQGLVTLLWLQVPIGLGLLFSLYFTYVQAFVLRAFCTWCLLSALDFLLMALAVFIFPYF